MIGTFIFSGCINGETKADIYTSIYPVEFITKEIVQDRFVVKSIYPRGKDIHDYDPTPKDIISMSNSKIIFYIGLGLEAIIEKSKDSTFSHIPTIPLSYNMSLVEVNSEDGHHHNDDDHDDDDHIIYDPHVWLDPEKMKTMTDNVLENIINYLDVTNEDIEFFTNNAKNLKAEFNTIDDEYYSVAYSNDIADKTIMVDHDSYAYWEIRYGIKRIRMRNDNESSDVIPKEMEEKINQAKELGIKYIVTTKNELESSILSQYIRELGLTNDAIVKLHNLSTITAKEEEAGDDYFSIMRENLEVLKVIFIKK